MNISTMFLLLRNSSDCCLFAFASLPHMSICAGVIVAVALKQIDCTPDAKTCAQSDNESLKNGYCAIEKCHNIFLLKFEIVLRIEKALRTTGIKTGRKA
jgi:hypothetical protein